MKLFSKSALRIVVIVSMIVSGYFPTLYDTVSAEFEGSGQTDVYISPNGNDELGDGSRELPYRTIEKAQEWVRTVNQQMTSDIHVYFLDGLYTWSDTVKFTTADSGTSGFSVIYEAAPGASPVISGGQQITGWSLDSNNPQLWKAESIELDDFRQLYVNGNRAVRARSEESYKGESFYNPVTNIMTNPKASDPDEPETLSYLTADGIVVQDNVIGFYDHPEDLELVWERAHWRHFRHKAENIIAHPSEAGKKVILMQQPGYNYGISMSGPGSLDYLPSHRIEFYFENAFELLDQPGEWYYNRTTETVYYYPLPGENMAEAEVFAPVLERLLELKGDGVGEHIQNLVFRGLNFVHGAWLGVNEHGFANVQAQFLNHYEGRQSTDPNHVTLVDGHISLDYASRIQFEHNVFEHHGGTAIQMLNGVSDVSFIGNIIRDVSDAAFLIGSPWHNFIDLPEEELVTDLLISNNVITRIGVEYRSAPAITSFYTNGLEISNNDISFVPYSAVSLGWGWRNPSNTNENNKIINNRISDVLEVARDGGGIYILGRQISGEVSGNYIKNQYNDQAAIYFDNGSENYIVYNNVLDNVLNWMFIADPVNTNIDIQHNYTTSRRYLVVNANEPGGNIFENNIYLDESQRWPEQAHTIISNAGLELEYQHLLDTPYPETPLYNEPYGKVNIAQGKQTKAYDEDGQEAVTFEAHGAWTITDGDAVTYAEAVTEEGGIRSVEIDLRGNENVSGILVQLSDLPTNILENLVISTSLDGVLWKERGRLSTVETAINEIQLTPAFTRYVKVEASDALSIAEIEVYTESNIAIGKKANAYYRSGRPATMGSDFPVSNAVDGKYGYQAQATGEYAWILEIDLSIPQPVYKVVNHFHAMAYATDYRIQTSLNGEVWQEAALVTDGRGNMETVTFAPREARYVRVEALKPDGPSQKGGQMGIIETEIYAQNNLALHKPTVAYLPNGNVNEMPAQHLSSFAVDGNKSTYASSEESNAWQLQVDLGADKEVSKLIVKFGPDQVQGEFDVLTSLDGEQWDLSAHFANTEETEVVELDLITPARFIRVAPSAPLQTMRIAELEVYEMPSYTEEDNAAELTNVALHKPAKGYYRVNGQLKEITMVMPASKAVNGRFDDYALAFGSHTWILAVDLEEAYSISKMNIDFPTFINYYASEYKILASLDGVNWNEVRYVTGSNGQLRETHVLNSPVRARYIAVEGLKPDGPNQEGIMFSLTELEVYGELATVNTPPQLQTIANMEVDSTQSISFSVIGTDANPWDELSYSVERLPIGALINSETGLFTWEPTNRQIGTHTMIVKVRDLEGATASQEMSITVHAHESAPLPLNQAPILEILYPPIALVGVQTQFTVDANDEDEQDQLIFSASNLPKGASFDSLTRQFEWIPGLDQIGSHQVVFRVSDGALFHEQIITITVEELGTNIALNKPALGLIRDNINPELWVPVTMLGKASNGVDGNYNTPAYAANTYGWIFQVDLEEVFSLNRMIVTSTKNSWPGYYATEYKVRTSLDGVTWFEEAHIINGNGDQEVIRLERSVDARYVSVEGLTPNGANQPGVMFALGELEVFGVEALEHPSPEMEDIPNQSVEVDSELTFVVSAADTSGNNLLYQIEGMPSGAVFHSSTGQFKWTPDPSQVGSYDVTFVVSNGPRRDQRQIKIDVLSESLEYVGNIALNKPAIAYYRDINGEVQNVLVEGDDVTIHPDYPLFKGNDGNTGSSALVIGSYKWIYGVDLGESQPISKIVVMFPQSTNAWPNYYATEYKIHTSNDGEEWTELKHVQQGNGERFAYKPSQPIDARYVYVESLKPDAGGQLGSIMSVSELEVYVEEKVEENNAQLVTALIAALPSAAEIVLTDANAIENARQKYDALIENEQVQVTNLGRLIDAEAALKILQVIAVTSVSLDKSTASIEVGSKLQLIATLSPSNATNKSVTWMSNDTNVVIVDGNGEVTAIGAGNAVVTVQSMDGDKRALANITVTEALSNVAIGKTAKGYVRSSTNMNEWNAATMSASLSNGTDGKFDKPVYAANTYRWIYVIDLESKHHISNMIVSSAKDIWPGYYATEFQILTSLDEINWSVEALITDSDGATEDIHFEQPVYARYVAVEGLTPNGPSQPGVMFAVSEVEIFGWEVVEEFNQVEEILVTPTTLSLFMDSTQQLNAVVSPADATNKSYTWSSDNESVATVSESGLVMAIGVGTATITATTNDGGKTASVEVVVTVSIVQQVIALLEALPNGSEVALTDAAAIANARQQYDALSEGEKAQITNVARLTDAEAVLESLQVIAVTSVNLDRSTASIEVGSKLPLTATVSPSNATNKNVIWGSSHSNVATVDEHGEVTAVGVGTAIITVTSVEGAKSATVSITVFSSTPEQDPPIVPINEPVEPSNAPVRSTNGTLHVPMGGQGEVSFEKLVTIFIPKDSTPAALELIVKRVEEIAGLFGNEVNQEQEKQIQTNLVSSVFEITKNFSSNFAKPVTLTFKFDTAKVQEDDTVAVYYYDELEKVWVRIGGTVAGDQIKVEVDHFTKFAVFVEKAAESGQTDNTEATDPTDVTFTDTEGHWAEAFLKQPVSLGIVNGYSDGTFKPDQRITREEFIVMLMRGLKPVTQGASLTFTDTAQISTWAQEAVARAVELGIISGYSDNTIRPQAVITRVEMTTIAAKILKLHTDNIKEEVLVTTFADDEVIPGWAKAAVAAVQQKGIILGQLNNKFIPYGQATRAEALTIIVRALDALEELPGS